MKPKRVPRLWCALQGLLPLDAALSAPRGDVVRSLRIADCRPPKARPAPPRRTGRAPGV